MQAASNNYKTKLHKQTYKTQVIKKQTSIQKAICHECNVNVKEYARTVTNYGSNKKIYKTTTGWYQICIAFKHRI